MINHCIQTKILSKNDLSAYCIYNIKYSVNYCNSIQSVTERSDE